MSSIHWLLAVFALPEIGLSAIFVVSLVSATLLPLGSEPVVFGYVTVSPHMFWPAILIGTAGNTIGGAISYAMGRGAHRALENWRERRAQQRLAEGLAEDEHEEEPGTRKRDRWEAKARAWMERMGPPALLFSWLPAVGDPLCAAAGWLRLSFWPCVVYMAIGKFLRYLGMTAFLLWVAGKPMFGV